MEVFLNGEFIDVKEAKVSVFDHGFLCGDGIYETMRTYGAKLWNFDSHFERFKSSAEFLLIKIPYSKDEIRNFIEELIKRNAFPHSRIRITLTRGVNDYDFSSALNPSFLVTVSELKAESDSVYREGVDTITVPFHRIIPEIKSISLLPMVRARQIALQKGAFEALYVNERGFLTEGSRTNAYFVLNGVIYVPEIDILPGTTRELVLKMAGQMGFDVVFKSCDKEAFYEAEEIFLSNALLGIVPVKTIDGFHVADKVPGPVTQKLIKAFNEKIESFIDAK